MNRKRHVLRQQVVAWARAHGLKEATWDFGCLLNTVCKWVRRFDLRRPSFLRELSREAPEESREFLGLGYFGGHPSIGVWRR